MPYRSMYQVRKTFEKTLQCIERSGAESRGDAIGEIFGISSHLRVLSDAFKRVGNKDIADELLLYSRGLIDAINILDPLKKE